MAERILKVQETDTSGKHEAHSFVGIQGFQPVIFIFLLGGRGLLCLPFIDSDTLNSNTVKWY